jgi:ABC-2 type transport system permease protein/oleandomycin transport system permease protein
MSRSLRALADVAAMTRRNLFAQLRVPALLATATALPVMWVLLFNYVFGGALQEGDVRYIDYLVPGVMALAVTFNLNNSSVAVAEDVNRGMIQRFRSLPITRWSMLAGRALFDTLRNLLALGMILAVGSLAGFRYHDGAARAVGGIALLLAFGFAASWLGSLVGLVARNVETASMGSLLFAIPLTFVSSLFVPLSTMPGWLQAVAKVNPVTHAVDASRALSIGGPAAEAIVWTLAWTVVLLALLVPLTVRQYRKMST